MTTTMQKPGSVRRAAALAAAIAAFAGVGAAAPRAVWAAPFTATYSFAGTQGQQISRPVDANPPGATLTDLVRGSGLNPNAAANAINSSGFTTGTTPDPNDYYGFRITPAADFSLSLSQITFSDQRSGTGPKNFALRSSQDNFVADLFSYAISDANTGTNTRTFNLGSVAALQNLNTGVELRIFGFNAEGGAGTYRLNNTLTLSGDLSLRPAAPVIPEPATAVLLGAAGAPLLLAAAGQRRRRRFVRRAAAR